MKITVYTINDCPFCKQEKEYLGSKSLAFEEKNLESNKEFLTEMLAISNNFAGAPVTKIEKDDGQIAILKGFTKEEFDTTLGVNAQQANAQMTPPAPLGGAPVVPESPVVPPPPVETPTPPLPTMPVTEPETTPPITPPVAEAPSQMIPPPPLSGVPTSVSEAPVTPPIVPNVPPQTDEALNSILNDLQKKVSEMPPPVPQTPVSPVV